MPLTRRGMILILSSPSGAGKTTLTRMLLQDKALDLTLSISVTTRPRRTSEADGIHYHFIDRRQYDTLKAGGDLLEAAEVHGNGYGTPRRPVDEVLAQGRDMLFDIDWQGTQQLTERARQDLVSVFILPPSTAELERRLIRRAQDPPNVVATRMAKAADEMSHWAEYDYVILNVDIARSLEQLKSILTAERLKRDRQLGLSDFVKALRAGR